MKCVYFMHAHEDMRGETYRAEGINRPLYTINNSHFNILFLVDVQTRRWFVCPCVRARTHVLECCQVFTVPPLLLLLLTAPHLFLPVLCRLLLSLVFLLLPPFS